MPTKGRVYTGPQGSQQSTTTIAVGHFAVAYANTMAHEGYYANLPGDKGGETYRGIARNFFPNWAGWSYVDQEKAKKGGSLPNNYRISNPVLDTLVKSFFFSEKWSKNRLGEIKNEAVAKLVFDFVVHSSYAVREIQKALNSIGYSVSTDNLIGSFTLTAINDADPNTLYQAIKQQRIEYLKSLNSTFEKSWLARVNQFNDFLPTAGVSVAAVGLLAGAGFLFYSKIKKV